MENWQKAPSLIFYIGIWKFYRVSTWTQLEWNGPIGAIFIKSFKSIESFFEILTWHWKRMRATPFYHHWLYICAVYVDTLTHEKITNQSIWLRCSHFTCFVYKSNISKTFATISLPQHIYQMDNSCNKLTLLNIRLHCSELVYFIHLALWTVRHVDQYNKFKKNIPNFLLYMWLP